MLFDMPDTTFYILLTTTIMFLYATAWAYEASMTPRRHGDWGVFWNIVGPTAFGLCGFSILLA
jgi:hypothetical protein